MDRSAHVAVVGTWAELPLTYMGQSAHVPDHDTWGELSMCDVAAPALTTPRP